MNKQHRKSKIGKLLKKAAKIGGDEKLGME